MSNVTLSAGVRQNLLALQQTSAQMLITQNDLATGKKVNSALDNPSSYFTSQALSDRASDLGTLLDQIGQAVQTISAANDGITSLTSLVQSAKSIATQAQQTAKGTVNYTNVVGTLTNGIAADQSQATGTTAVASSGAVASRQSSLVINASNLGGDGLTSGDTLQVTDGTTTATFEYLTGTNTASGGATGFTNAASLLTDLSTAFGTTASITDSGNTFTIQSNNAQNYTTNYTATGTSDLTTLTTATTAVDGDTLTVSDGTHTATFRYVTTAGNAANGTFSDAADLVSAINNANSSVHGDITASPTGSGSGYLTLTAAKTVSISAGGNIGSDLGFGASAVSDNYNSTLAGLSGTLSIQVAGSSTPDTLTFGSSNGEISTATELSQQLSGLTDITGSINSSNQIDFTPTSSAAVTIGGTASVVTGLGLTSGTTTPTATVVSANSTRASLQDQYNAVLTQIDQLAGDSSYNGVNLINGDNLTVTFNETGTSSLTIQGVNLDSTGLGLNDVSGTGFQDNNVINNTLNSLDTALTTLRSQASTFGSNLSTVQTRQDFTNNMINTLQTGSDNLVLADTNEEGADLLALQTRQQLSTTALSLSAQADQNVLKLFGG
jgi:flagellin